MASHVGICTPGVSERITSFPCHRSPPLLRNGKFCGRIKAAADNRGNLDQLQRATLNQSQPKKKAAPVSSPGIWDSFPTARTVQQMMETMERIMEDPFAYGVTWPSQQERARSGYSRGRTPWAIKEWENDYKIRFDMPGMTKNDVKVWVEESMLVIKAEKVPRNRGNTDESTIEEEEWPTNDYGSYSTRIALPENIEFEKIKAEVKDGVLYITVPKASSTSKIMDINVQ